MWIMLPSLRSQSPVLVRWNYTALSIDGLRSQTLKKRTSPEPRLMRAFATLAPGLSTTATAFGWSEILRVPAASVSM